MASSSKVPDPIKKKRKIEKYEFKKTVRESIVKCSLRGVLIGDKNQLVAAIEKRVVECSIRTHNASLALNILIREQFQNVDDVTEVDLPEFWDPTFIRQLFLGTASAQQPHAIVTSLFQRHPYVLSNIDRSIGDRNIYSFAATKLSANVRNHLVTNFMKILKKYLYNLSDLNIDEAIVALYKINGWTMKARKKVKKKVETEPEINMDKVNGIVNFVREVLDLETDDKLGKSWFKAKSSLPLMMRWFVFVNRKIQTYNIEQLPLANETLVAAGKIPLPEMKLFSILPICRIKAHYITIDTSVMKGVLHDIGYVYDKEIEDAPLWKCFMNTERCKGANATFTRTIDTDGTSVNIHYYKPKDVVLKGDEDEEKVVCKVDLTGKRVIANDPGRANIFYMVEELTKGIFKSYTMTRGQYYTEAGINIAIKRSNKWNKKVQTQLTQLSTASPKSCDLVAFMQYITIVVNGRAALQQLYHKKCWREQSLRLYGGKKRTLLSIFGGVLCYQ